MGRSDVGFSGFPAGSLATALPNLFFTAVLPAITSVEELIVTLYFFFAQGRLSGPGKRRSPRSLSREELAADATLMAALANFSDDPLAALSAGLALAVKRGTLVQAIVEDDGGRQELYLLNTPANRRALAGKEGPRLEPREVLPPATPPLSPAPSIFRLYEENVGPLTPLIAQELAEAEGRYPPLWIEAAFREAVGLNKRSWRYIQKILERWEAEGPDYEAPGRDPSATATRKRPLSGRYRYLVRR